MCSNVLLGPRTCAQAPGGKKHGQDRPGSAVREADVSRPGGACGQSGARQAGAREFRAGHPRVGQPRGEQPRGEQPSVGHPPAGRPGPTPRVSGPAAPAQPGPQPAHAGERGAQAEPGRSDSATAGSRNLDSAAGLAPPGRACQSRAGLQPPDGTRGSAATLRHPAGCRGYDSAAGVRGRADCRAWSAAGVKGRAGGPTRSVTGTAGSTGIDGGAGGRGPGSSAGIG
jgi:hypothetical protein